MKRFNSRFFSIPILSVLLLAILIMSACSGGSTQATTSASAPGTTPAAAVITKPVASTTAPAATTTPVASTPASTGGPVYGGTMIRMSAMIPGTPIGWPAESFTEDATGILEGLLLMNQDGTKVTPKLATAWEVAQDKKSIKITLRKGVKYHDGSDFNATTAKFDIDAYIAAKRAPLWGSVDILDDYTLNLNLVRWENSAIQSLGAAIYVSKAAYDKNGLEWMRWNVVGTGAFKFVSYKKTVALIMTKNENYWDKGLPYLDGVQWVYIADKMTMTAAFKAGQAHTMRMGTLMEVAAWRTGGGQVITALETGAKQSPTCLWPDSKNADSPWSILKVRIALEYAINKEAIIKARSFGFWQPAYQLAFMKASDFNPNLTPRIYDPAKAKQLLAEAGYPNGFKTRIIPQPGFIDQDSVVAIQNQLKDVGIDAQIELTDSGKLSAYQQKGWNNALLMQGTSFSPNFAMTMKGISNYSTTIASLQIPNDYQAALDDALTTLDPQQDKMQALSKAAYDNEIVIPLWYNCEGAPYQKGIHDHGDKQTAGVLSWTPEYCWLEKSAWINVK